MIEKSTNQRVLEYFFTSPTKEIHLRELARETKLSLPTILLSVKKLEQEKLVMDMVRSTPFAGFVPEKALSRSSCSRSRL